MQFINMFTGERLTPTAWQAALQVGDYYYIAGDPTGAVGIPPIYGQIVAGEGAGGKGFFWARGHSIFCPEGETGIVCICDTTRKLTPEEFAAARARGWDDRSVAAQEDA